jgi:hypothetical protein
MLLFRIQFYSNVTWIEHTCDVPHCETETYLAVETKSLSSPPHSSNCSNVLASPVDCKPITTHWNGNRYTSLHNVSGLATTCADNVKWFHTRYAILWLE